jgi:RND superfamily putative drug exporter
MWTGLADRVIRRPVVVVLSVVAVLAALALPALGLTLGSLDVNGLPAGNAARVAQESLTANFPNANNGATLVVQTDRDQRPDQGTVAAVTEAAEQVHGVRLVVQLSSSPKVVVLQAVLSANDFTNASEDTVLALRRIAAPPHTVVLVGGENALEADSNTAILHGLPAMMAIMVGATLVLMLLAFRSLVLPVKAVVMAGFSLVATFGVLTWIFQNDHRAQLLGITAGPLPAAALIMVVAVIFGLSTDYEVFLMSRMVEAHDKGATTAESIRKGMAGTGRVITAAASLLLIVTGAAGLSEVNLVKVAAVGMAIAIFIDATVVRMLLVPAVIKLMGNANWWFPRGLLGFGKRRPSEPEPGAESATSAEARYALAEDA